MLKKAGAFFLVFLCCCLMVLPVSAADVTFSAGGILIPVHFSDQWNISTPAAIAEDLQEKRSLSQDQVADYMNTFGYTLWLTENRGDREIITICRSAQEQKDYASQSPEQINSLAQEQVRLYTQSLPFTVSRIERYHAGDVLFLRYRIDYEGKPYGWFCRSVANGWEVEIRFMLDGKEPSDTLRSDYESIANAIGTAFTDPENYESAPETTAHASAEATDPAIILPGGTEDGILNLLNQTQPADDSSQQDSQNDDEERTTAQDPNVILVGEEGETLLIEDAENHGDHAAGIAKNKIIAIVVLLFVALVLFVAAVVMKKRREKQG